MYRTHPVPSSPRLLAIGLAAIAALGVASILLATHWGAGLTDDSYYYVKPARDVLAGQPFNMDTSWQPLLPFALILLGWLKIDLLAGARILNALLFGGSLLLIGLTLKRVTSSTAFALLGAGLALLSSDFIDVHSWLMSEALFFFTSLLAIYLLVVYLDTRRLGWLAAAGFAANLAVLTRFIGAALVFAGIVAILLVPRAWQARLRDALVFGAVASLPTALYLLNNWLTTGVISHRLPFVWGPFYADAYAKALYNMLLWLMPGRLAKGHEFLVLGVLLALATAGAALFAITHRERARDLARSLARKPALWLLAVLAASNLAILYYSWGYTVETDMRKLSPTHLALLLAVVVVMAGLWRAGSRITRAGIAALLVIFAGFNLVRSVQTVQTFYAQGAGYANRYWAVSEASAFLSQHPDAGVVSTAPFGLYFKLGRLTQHVVDYASPDSLDAFLRETHGYLVVFSGMPLELYGFDEASYTQGLVKVKSFDDATLYQIDP